MLISHKLKLGPSTFYFKIMPKLKENKDRDQKGGNFGGSKNVQLQREYVFENANKNFETNALQSS